MTKWPTQNMSDINKMANFDNIADIDKIAEKTNKKQNDTIRQLKQNCRLSKACHFQYRQIGLY